MPTQRKIDTLEQLTEKMSRMQFAVVADYRGMTVAELYELRNKMYEGGADVVIAKNTLLRMAARATGHDALESLLVGPTAITFAYDDPAKVAKLVSDYLKEAKKYTVRGGILGTTVIPADELDKVSKMPARETLYAQIAGGIQSPLSGMVGILGAPVSNLVHMLNNIVSDVVNVMQARIDQLQSASSS